MKEASDEKIENLEKQIVDQEKESNHKIENLMNERDTAEIKIEELDQIIQSQEEGAKIMKTLNENLEEESDILKKQLEEETITLKQEIKELEMKNFEYLDTLEKTSTKFAYISKKTDKIDTALGKFINSQTDCDKLKILFLRISEGVYCFGKRTLNMKIVNENHILIRTGGGYIEIKEFMDKFS